MTVKEKEKRQKKAAEIPAEEPPPVLKSWKNIYLVVLANLLLWIILFYIFTWIFK